MMEDWMPSSHHKVIDFDLEAHKLWKQLNLDHESQKTSKQLASIDPIFKYKTGGTIYVGGAQAAKDLNLLKARKITSIVNTTYEIHGKHRTVPNFHEGKLRYCDIDIAHWRSQTNDSDNSIITFTSQLFSFIEDALIHGESVLIHCLAGAHRAGTTAISCLIHFAQLEVAKAIAVAKLCRPIIDPLGDFPIFLERLYTAEKNRGIRPFTSAASMGGILCKLLGCSISRSTRINSSTVAPVNSCRDGGQTLTLSNTTPYENSKCGGEMYCMPDSSNETSGQGGAVVVGEYPHVKNHDHFTNSYYDETSRRSNNGNNTSSNGVVQSMH